MEIKEDLTRGGLKMDLPKKAGGTYVRDVARRGSKEHKHGGFLHLEDS